MGLAVLPARLKGELEGLCKAIVAGEDLRKDEVLEKHADWVDELKEKYTFTAENVEEILKKEIGIVFKKVLEHAGVYNCTEEGRRGRPEDPGHCSSEFRREECSAECYFYGNIRDDSFYCIQDRADQ